MIGNTRKVGHSRFTFVRDFSDEKQMAHDRTEELSKPTKLESSVVISDVCASEYKMNHIQQ